jgi:FAD/FMN-containing dehydrogenase
MVDTSSLNRVLSVDRDKKVAVVEPNVSMDKLVDATLRHGLIPTVVPEFPGITVGGAIQGTGAETSSHKYGCVSDTANWMEYILGNGSVVRASRTQHADLFYGSAGSCGSLGLITAAEIKLIRAPKYVHVTHYLVESFTEAVAIMEKNAHAGSDFIEWVMLSKNYGIVR